MREVPTSTPMPIVEINRSWDGDNVKERGRIPARKDATAITRLKLSSVNRPAMLLRCGGKEGYDNDVDSRILSESLRIHLKMTDRPS